MSQRRDIWAVGGWSTSVWRGAKAGADTFSYGDEVVISSLEGELLLSPSYVWLWKGAILELKWIIDGNFHPAHSTSSSSRRLSVRHSAGRLRVFSPGGDWSFFVNGGWTSLSWRLHHSSQDEVLSSYYLASVPLRHYWQKLVSTVYPLAEFHPNGSFFKTLFNTVGLWLDMWNDSFISLRPCQNIETILNVSVWLGRGARGKRGSGSVCVRVCEWNVRLWNYRNDCNN